MLVLAVDDDDDDLDILKDTLAKIHPSITCITARNGHEALNYMTGDIIALPDIIFLDINMPGMTGRDTLVALRSIQTFQKIKIVMFSTSISPNDRQLFHQYNAEYEIKPSSITSWSDVVSKKVEPYFLS